MIPILLNLRPQIKTGFAQTELKINEIKDSQLTVEDVKQVPSDGGFGVLSYRGSYPTRARLTVAGSGILRNLVALTDNAVFRVEVDGNLIAPGFEWASDQSVIKDVNLAAGGIRFKESFIIHTVETPSNSNYQRLLYQYTLGD